MLQQVYKATGEMPEELSDLPDFPHTLGYLWSWFCELQNSAETIISYQDIQAFTAMTFQKPSPNECMLLRSLSKLYIRST